LSTRNSLGISYANKCVSVSYTKNGIFLSYARNCLVVISYATNCLVNSITRAALNCSNYKKSVRLSASS
jgi:hypothetical protein